MRRSVRQLSCGRIDIHSLASPAMPLASGPLRGVKSGEEALTGECVDALEREGVRAAGFWSFGLCAEDSFRIWCFESVGRRRDP